jgi:small-conductance mechanosensitive channel
MNWTYNILNLSVSEFKRLRKGVRVLTSYGVTYDEAVRLIIERIEYVRSNRDRQRIERRAS